MELTPTAIIGCGILRVCDKEMQALSGRIAELQGHGGALMLTEREVWLLGAVLMLGMAHAHNTIANLTPEDRAAAVTEGLRILEQRSKEGA